MNKNLKELFLDCNNSSQKWEKYFGIYDECFSNFKGKNITFVEIGVHNGGSLEVWKKFFGEKAKIIGIDLNPECKKFEQNGIKIFIGNQSDPKFWDNFFKEVGNVDIILDDGGHTNLDQIITAVSTIDKINDNGMLIIEDVHTSYRNEYNSNPLYSFINFSKKIIDDINYTFDNNKKFQFSLNKYIYSVQFYESIVVFKINRHKTIKNKLFSNKGYIHNIDDLTWEGNRGFNKNIEKIINLVKFKKLKKFIKYHLKNAINNKKINKYFK